MEYGYARVSSRDQNVDRQLDALKAFPLDDRRIYVDHYSGADFNRPRYRCLERRLTAGDVLVVTSIDRLGRNYEEILHQWRMLTHERGVDIVVLDMPLLDTRAGEGSPPDVTRTFISDLLLQLLSYVAQIERENIKRRQAEGIAAARARGTRFGRPSKARPVGTARVLRCVRAGSLSKTKGARQLGVSRSTLDKWIEQDEARELFVPESGSAADARPNIPEEGANLKER